MRFSILLILTCLPFFSFSQIGKPLRIEIEAKALVDDYFVIPAGEYGLLLLFDDEDDGGKDAWSVTFYTTEFKERWTRRIQFDTPMRLLNEGRYMNMQLTLFIPRSARNDKACLLRVNLDTDSLKQSFIDLPHDFEPEYFLVGSTKSYMIGNSSSSQVFRKSSGQKVIHPSLVIFDNNSESYEIRELQDVQKSQILSAMHSIKDDRLEMLLRPMGSKHESELNLMVLDSDGKLRSSTIIPSPKGRSFADAKIARSNDGRTVVLGTYNSTKYGYGAIAEGMFMTLIGPSGIQFSRFHSFLDFKTSGYLIPSSTYRKALKKQSKGQDASLEIRLLFTDEVVVIDSTFVVRAEAYHPEYRTEYRYDPFYGYGHTVQVFEGWRYDDVLVAGFDSRGNLVWDHSMRIGNILQPTGAVREHVQLLSDDKDLIVVYTAEGDLYSMVINQGMITENRTKTEIETGARGDVVKANYRSDLTFWYNGYILVWGYQRIRTDGRKREVFFFNKIAYR